MSIIRVGFSCQMFPELKLAMRVLKLASSVTSIEIGSQNFRVGFISQLFPELYDTNEYHQSRVQLLDVFRIEIGHEDFGVDIPSIEIGSQDFRVGFISLLFPELYGTNKYHQSRVQLLDVSRIEIGHEDFGVGIFSTQYRNWQSEFQSWIHQFVIP